MDEAEAANPYEEGGVVCLVASGEPVSVLETRVGSAENPQTVIRWPDTGDRTTVYNYEIKDCDDGSE